MAVEPLQIFDPRRNFQLQGFTGRAATTTIHDATATSVSISGIFQAAEDFAVLGFWSAYDYFNHLRVKHLPRTDLSGLKLEFDIEYDHALDGAMQLDAAKFASVSWDAMTFVCGVGGPTDIYEVRLLDHATVVSGGETPASCQFEAGGIAPYFGIDYVHLYFRDTRYTVAHTDCIVETTLSANVTGGTSAQDIPVASSAGIEVGDYAYIERTGTNEELVRVVAVGTGTIRCIATISHPAGSFVTLQLGAKHMLQKLAQIINTPGDPVIGRFGPDQSGVISASATVFSTSVATLQLQFATPALPASRYGKLGNIDRVLVTSGHVDADPPDPPGLQQIDWSGGSGTSRRFSGGDNDTKYHIALDFTQPLLDKLDRTVPMADCRKMYMVFAPRFEITEQELEDGCFLTAGVGVSDTVWQVDDSSKLAGGRYFIGTPSAEERVRLVSLDSATQITVERGYQSSMPGTWATGVRVKKLSPMSGFASDAEWGATISNITVTGDRALKVGGAAPRIEESDGRCKYTGSWEDYKYSGGFPTQWWSSGHAKRTAPGSALDVRKVRITYSKPETHDLHLGTFLYTNCGKVSVSVDGAATTHDLYLAEFGGTTANLKVRANVAAGNHTVEITALFDKNAASTGYYFYFDYLWPMVPQDVPDAPEVLSDVSLAIDFDTDHGYKKPPAWHLWHLQKLGLQGHADVYMGVFWNNKRQRVGAAYPYATIAFSGDPVPGDVASITISGTTINHAIGYGETLQSIVSQMRAALNGTFAGVWADDNFGTSATLRVQSKAPSWTFPSVSVGSPNSVTLTLTNNLGTAGSEGDWELIDSVSPVMTEGARKWICDLAGQFQMAGIMASFAFSMEVYRPPVDMAAKYWDGAPVELPVPSTQMHFGSRVRAYLKQMYKECADEIAAAGLPVVLQFGETQWWYFPNASGMPYYDDETKAAFEALYGHPMHHFLANTDDPNADIQTADFLRDRIWSYCQDVIAYVRQFHPGAVFECLWPLDANQGKPSPDPAFRALNMHVNLPNEWKNSSYGIKYFRAEGFDYDVWQKNSVRMRQTITYANSVLGRPAAECIYLAGIYGPPDPPMAQAYGMWRAAKLYSMCFWAFDQLCLNSRPIPLDVWTQARATAVTYHKPRAARALEATIAVPVAAGASGAMNRFHLNEGRLNGDG